MDDSILEKNRSDWSSFAQEDAFNSGNYVEGHISRHSGDDYGALYIQKVNGIKCSQLIYCTPKIQYPFDSTGHWHWPKAKIIERYEKLDGTNIFAYKYVDSKGGEFLSYKTRLLPFIGNSRFGPFLDMWNEILKTNSKIVRLCKYSRENFSFELWGARNPHLVKYEVPLKASLLFARSGQKIIPCNHIVQTINPDLYDCASFRGNVDRDYIWNYQESQKNLEASLKEVEDGYMGQEGEVWYLQDETDQWIMFKCLDGRTKILTDNGWIKIRDIVQKQLKNRVQVVYKNHVLGWNKISGWHSSCLGNRKVYKIWLKYSPKFGDIWKNQKNNYQNIKVTSEHEFMTTEGWMSAESLTNTNRVYTGNYSPNKKQMEIINGTMLGDGFISRDGCFAISQTDIEYAELKYKSLDNFKHWKNISNKKQLNRKSGLNIKFASSNWSKELREKWYPNGIKIVPKDLELTDLVVAIWYMDDGNARHRSNLDGSLSSNCNFATMGFSNDDVKLLSQKLKEYGIDNTISKGNSLLISVDETVKLFNKIGVYIHPSMKRKVNNLTPSFNMHSWDIENVLDLETDFICKEEITNSYGKNSIFYCIDVENSHHFITKCGVVHNCKPETIEQIHWSAGGIGKNIIKATIENAFENWDCPTVDQIKGLLKEEFSESEIEKIHYSIIKHLDEAIKNHEFALSVLREYRSLGMSILENKSGVMRALSSKFNRGEITKVFSVIWNSEIK